MRFAIAVILAFVFITPLVPSLEELSRTELYPGVYVQTPLIPRPYTLGITIVGGEITLEGKHLSDFIIIHFGDSGCSYLSKRVLGRVVYCDLRKGVEFWEKILRELGVDAGRAEEVLEALKSRGAGAIATPTITIRLTLYDDEGNEYYGIITISPLDYYLAQGYEPDKAMMRFLERPLEFIERGLVVIIERDQLVTRLIKVPRLTW